MVVKNDDYTVFEFFYRYNVRVFSAPSLNRSEVIRRRRSRMSRAERIKDYLRSAWFTIIEDLKLLRNLPYMLFACSNFLLYMVYNIPYMNLPDYLIELGYSQQESSRIVSLIGIFNTIGMITVGIVADRRLVNNELLYAFAMVTCGLATLTLAWIQRFSMFCVAAAVFGMFISANYALTSVILVDITTLHTFVYAYGMLCFCQGVGTLLGPALAGYLFDWTGSYFTTFVLGGSAIVLSGLLVLVIVIIYRIEGKTPEFETAEDFLQLGQ